MKEFIGSSYNEIAARKEDGSYEPLIELVVLASSVNYEFSYTGDIVKECIIHEFRFAIGIEGLRKFAKDLLEYAGDVEAKDGGRMIQIPDGYERCGWGEATHALSNGQGVARTRDHNWAGR